MQLHDLREDKVVGHHREAERLPSARRRGGPRRPLAIEAGHARFCKTCGIRVFGHGHLPMLGGDYCTVNLNCLDDADLTGVPVVYVDGLHNTWAPIGSTTYVNPSSAAKVA